MAYDTGPSHGHDAMVDSLCENAGQEPFEISMSDVLPDIVAVLRILKENVQGHHVRYMDELERLVLRLERVAEKAEGEI